MNNSVSNPVDVPAKAKLRRNWLIRSVAGVAALAGFGLALHTYRSTDKAEALDPAFWQLQFAAPDGQVLNMASFRGKPLILNFWASWCPPCIEELPLLSSFYNSNLANGWQVLGLAVDEPLPVRRFLERFPISFPVAMAGLSGVEISRSLGNSIGGLPFTVLIDSAGQIARRKMGRLNSQDLRSWAASK